MSKQISINGKTTTNKNELMLFHVCKTTDNTEKGQYQKTIIEFPFWRDEKLSAIGVMCLFSIVGPVNQEPF